MTNKTDLSGFQPEKKPRLTAYVDESVIRRAKAKGMLEGKTLSEVVEQALIEYTTDNRIKESLVNSGTGKK